MKIQEGFRATGLVLGLAGFLAGACGGLPDSDPIPPPQSAVLPKLGPVSSRFGLAKIREGEFSALARQVPWSGYWYPLSRQDFRSALEKFDRVSGAHSWDWERSRFQNEARPPLPWEGRCDAWAFASLLSPEPRAPLQVPQGWGSVTFSVAEQKALFILSHEQIDPEDRLILGERNDGDGASPFDDLLPGEFHRLLQVQLEERHQPFIMDRDPRPPVWNTPVYGGKWKIHRVEGSRTTFQVQASLYVVLPYDSDQDSTERNTAVLDYEYELETRPQGDADEVVASRWLGASRMNHPDFATLPLSRPDLRVRHRSRNPELDPDQVERLLGNRETAWFSLAE